MRALVLTTRLGLAAVALGSAPSALAKPVVKPKPAVLNCGAGAFLPVRKPASVVETTPTGLRFQTVRPGTGARPSERDYTLVGYKGSLVSGSVFDQNERAAFPVAGVVPGFGEALVKMQKGGVYRICIPAALGYGKNSPTPAIPPDSVLRFEVSLLDFATPEQIEEARGNPPEEPGGN